MESPPRLFAPPLLCISSHLRKSVSIGGSKIQIPSPQTHLNSPDSTTVPSLGNVVLSQWNNDLFPWDVDLFHWDVDLFHWDVDLFHWNVDLFRWDVDLFRWDVDLFRWNVDLFRWDVDLFRWDVDLFRWDSDLFSVFNRLNQSISGFSSSGLDSRWFGRSSTPRSQGRQGSPRRGFFRERMEFRLQSVWICEVFSPFCG
jgi:hypothetical protein